MGASENVQTPSPLPDIGDIIFLLVLQLLLFTMPNFVFGDGSTGWHLVTGEHILRTGEIPRHDLISYTFPDKGWVAYEWLFDVLIGAINRVAGLNGIAVLISSLVALLFLILYQRCRAAGCHFASATMLVVLGAIASSLHWLARPHVFTFFGVLVFFTSLERFRRGTISGARLTAWLALSMALWVNLHPAFLFGFVLLAVYLAAQVVAVAVAAGEDAHRGELQRLKWLGIAAGASMLATLLNPYGPMLYRYIGEYLHGGQVLSHTVEFGSPAFHGALQPTCFEVLIFLFIGALAVSRRRIALAQLISVLVFLGAALASVRNIPLFVIVALPVTAELLSDASLLFLVSRQGEAAAAGWWGRFRDAWLSLGSKFDETESRCRLHLIPVTAVGLLALAAVSGGKLLGVTLVDSGFDAKVMPTGTLDYIASHRLPPERLFNMDNWGGYIRYKLGIPVFIDDRADFYGERFYLRYGQVSTVGPGWRDILKEHNIHWVLFPKDSRLAARLKEEPDWRLAAEDPAASLFVRSGSSGGVPKTGAGPD